MITITPIIICPIAENKLSSEIYWAYISLADDGRIQEVITISPQMVNENYNNQLPIIEKGREPSSIENPFIQGCMVYDVSQTTNQIYFLRQNEDQKLNRYNFSVMASKKGEELSGKNILPSPLIFQYSPILTAWSVTRTAQKQRLDKSSLYLPFGQLLQAYREQVDNQYLAQQDAIKREKEGKQEQLSQWQSQRDEINLEALSQAATKALEEEVSLTATQQGILISSRGFFYNWQTLKSTSETKEEYCNHLKDILQGNVDLNDIQKNNAVMLRPYFYPSEINKLKDFYKEDIRAKKPRIGDVYDWQCELLIAELKNYQVDTSNLKRVSIPTSLREQEVGKLEIEKASRQLSTLAYSIFCVYQQIQSIEEKYLPQMILTIEGILRSEEAYWDIKADLELLFFASGDEDFHGKFRNLLKELRSHERVYQFNEILKDPMREKIQSFAEHIDELKELLRYLTSIKNQSVEIRTIFLEAIKENEKLKAIVKSNPNISSMIALFNLNSV